MSLETIIVGGEEYISSARAAKLVGYTKDYVGQLARAGKVRATRVGRSWYITEESIRTHKLNTHYTLTKQKKTYKRENKVAGKTMKNIVKTEKEKINGEITDVKFIEKKYDKDHDLFPKVKKDKRDILLHTDIKYEKVDPEKTLVQKDIKIKSDDHVYDGHLVNSSQEKYIKPVSMNKKGSSFKMDGVVKNKPPKNDFDIIEKDSMSNNILRNEKDFITRNNSKTISVIGSIILFTIFVLIYIFV